MEDFKIVDESRIANLIHKRLGIGLDDLIWDHIRKMTPKDVSPDVEWVNANISVFKTEHEDGRNSWLVKFQDQPCIEIFESFMTSSTTEGDPSYHHFVVKTKFISHVKSK